MKEIDIKCPGCGKVFQVTAKSYEENQDIVCPKCRKVIKPKGNEKK